MLQYKRNSLTDPRRSVQMSNSLVTPTGPIDSCSGQLPPDLHRIGVPRPLMNRLPLSPMPRTIGFALVLLLFSNLSFADPTAKKRKHRSTPVARAVVHKPVAANNQAAASRVPIRRVAAQVSRPAAPAAIIAGGPWTEPTYADSTLGDNVDGEDLDIRRAAVEALGSYNGSVVVVDPANGRVQAPNCAFDLGAPATISPPRRCWPIERIFEMARDHQLNEFRMSPCQRHGRAGRLARKEPSLRQGFAVPDLLRHHAAGACLQKLPFRRIARNGQRQQKDSGQQRLHDFRFPPVFFPVGGTSCYRSILLRRTVQN